MASMLLGHWYLNAPGMKIAPLQRLIVLIAWAIALRGVVAVLGATGQWFEIGPLTLTQTSLWALRWLAGLVGVGAAALLSARTLDIPNTQSATGILYVGVIGSFLGEMTAALLSTELVYPV